MPQAPSPVESGPPLIFDYEVQPRTNFTKAEFSFWSPPYDQPIRGIIVMVPGAYGDGRGMVKDPAWQSLAQKYRLALVGCFLQGHEYYEASQGTGDALLEALHQFSAESGHPEIFPAPLLLWGESAGGEFDYDFANWKPTQVMAFVVNKGAYYDSKPPNPQMCSTPGLFFLGKTDTPLRIKNITDLWTIGRQKGALWALAPQPGSGHEFSKTPAIARTFFEAVLKSRLPDDADTPQDASQMKTMQEGQGWLGDLATFDIHDGSADSEPNRNAAWLPDQDTAAAWKSFVSGGN